VCGGLEAAEVELGVSLESSHGPDGMCHFVSCMGVVVIDVVDMEALLMLLVMEDVDTTRLLYL
jgi:hypothetical protein